MASKRLLSKSLPKYPSRIQTSTPPQPQYLPDSSSLSVPTTQTQVTHLTKLVKLHLKPSFKPHDLVGFLKSHIRHHPTLSHLDFHLFHYAASLDTFRHDHFTFEWMAHSLIASHRLDSLNSLIQFMASNPCPCSDGIFSCPRNEFIFHSAINALCRAGAFDYALFAFDTMKRLIDGKPSVAIYNSLIHGFVKFRRYGDALEWYERMGRDRVKPDVITFNTLISGYCKSLRFGLALELFKEMKEKGCVPNVVSFNTLMKGFFREGKVEEGIGIAHEMIEMGCELSIITCEILIDELCTKGKAMEACDLMVDFSRKRVLPRDLDLFTLVECLCCVEGGGTGRALEMLDELWGKGHVPSVISCTTLIEGLCKICKIQEALNFTQRMLRENIVPDGVTFNCLLRDACDAGKAVEANNLRLLASMKGLDPDGMTYRILIVGYSKEGRKHEGEILLDEMLDKGFITDLATYNRLMDQLFCKRS